jgi:hypothetical protein
MEFSDIMLTWHDDKPGVMENILLMSTTQSQEYLRKWNNKFRKLLSLFIFKFLRESARPYLPGFRNECAVQGPVLKPDLK